MYKFEEIICPYCEYRQDIEGSFDTPIEDGDSIEMQCEDEDCGKTFKVTASVEVYYETEPIKQPVKQPEEFTHHPDQIPLPMSV